MVQLQSQRSDLPFFFPVSYLQVGAQLPFMRGWQIFDGLFFLVWGYASSLDWEESLFCLFDLDPGEKIFSDPLRFGLRLKCHLLQL